MTNMQMLEIPRSQRVFGALVYWITILAAVICILGPLVIFIDVDSNIINPHYEMSNIFNGMKPNFELQDLQANAMAGTEYLKVEDASKFDDPEDAGRDVAIRITGEDGRGEIATLVSINKDTNELHILEPLINSYDAQQTEVGEVTVWDARRNIPLTSGTQITATEDIDGHFWINHLTNGDGLTQLGLVLGCAVGVPAMGGAAIILALKEKSPGWALGAMVIALLILAAMLGLI